MWSSLFKGSRRCGDKDAKFVGSKKWIGSTEVSYVLDHLLGVSGVM